jgi:hypothetical protein
MARFSNAPRDDGRVAGPADLYAVDDDAVDALRAEAQRYGPPVLVHSLSGFLDAGGAGRLAVVQLLTALGHRTVATFDVDALFDYRARRPRMTFVNDHYESLELPELVLSALHDESGTPFLLLHGVEPDLGWQRFVASVEQLVELLGVRLAVSMHAVPWPAPHTRPVGLTAHATDRALVEGRTSWVGALEVPGHLAGMLELHLGATGHPAMGFAAHVPHYLAALEYPRAALALLEAVASSTGLVLPLDELRAAADVSDRDTDAQIATNPDNVEAVQALEQQYDVAVAQQGVPGRPTDGGLPSGEDIAAQVERFLAEMDDRGRDDG